MNQFTTFYVQYSVCSLLNFFALKRLQAPLVSDLEIGINHLRQFERNFLSLRSSVKYWQIKFYIFIENRFIINMTSLICLHVCGDPSFSPVYFWVVSLYDLHPGIKSKREFLWFLNFYKFKYGLQMSFEFSMLKYFIENMNLQIAHVVIVIIIKAFAPIMLGPLQIAHVWDKILFNLTSIYIFSFEIEVNWSSIFPSLHTLPSPFF